MFVVPEVGIVHQINDKLTFGIGAFGVSGMGVDYRNKRRSSKDAYHFPVHENYTSHCL
jgi:long-subunit fatty acid transport protein